MTRLELEWGSQAFQPLSFWEYVSLSAKPRATRLLKAMRRSRRTELPRFFYACDVLVVTEIQWVSQSVAAIALAQPKRLGQSQTLVEEFWWS